MAEMKKQREMCIPIETATWQTPQKMRAVGRFRQRHTGRAAGPGACSEPNGGDRILAIDIIHMVKSRKQKREMGTPV